MGPFALAVVVLATAGSVFVPSANARLPGGFHHLSPASKDGRAVITFVEKTLSVSTNSIFKTKVIDVHSLQSQVVAGTNYKLVFDAAQVSCSRKKLIRTCHVVGPVQACSAQVFRSLSHQFSANNITCHAKPVPVKPTGVKTDVTHSLESVPVVSFILYEINRNATTGNRYTLVKVVKVERQVVSGINYFVTLILRGKEGISTCRFVVLSKPWNPISNTLLVTSYSCVL